MIYVNCYYSTYHQAIILAAKEHQIKVIEIQHGIISSTQFYYNPSTKSNEKLLPDYLLVHNKYVSNQINDNYLSDSNIIPFGNFYLEYSKDNLKNHNVINQFKNKYKKIILISEQKSVKHKLNHMIKKLAQLYPDYGFVLALRDSKKNNIKNGRTEPNTIPMAV